MTDRRSPRRRQARRRASGLVGTARMSSVSRARALAPPFFFHSHFRFPLPPSIRTLFGPRVYAQVLLLLLVRLFQFPVTPCLLTQCSGVYAELSPASLAPPRLLLIASTRSSLCLAHALHPSNVHKCVSCSFLPSINAAPSHPLPSIYLHNALPTVTDVSRQIFCTPLRHSVGIVRVRCSFF